MTACWTVLKEHRLVLCLPSINVVPTARRLVAQNRLSKYLEGRKEV